MKKKHSDAFKNNSIKVPFVVPNIELSDKRAIETALKSNLLTDGPILRKFENEFCKFTGSKYAIGVSNATSALHLSLKSIGIKKGDEVIIPNITFVATANAVLYVNATPVLVDVNDHDINISIKSIEESITKKTKAIIPVHFAGKSCDMLAIQKLAKKYNLEVIEDCAHALGTKFNKTHVGNFGKTGCFSFYPTKNLTTFEGGMVITNSKKIASKIRSMRNHGINKSLKERFSTGYPWDFDVSELGYNFRLDEIRSSLGLNQLKRLHKMNKLRQDASRYYKKQLKSTKGIELLDDSNLTNNSCHLFVIKILKDFIVDRNLLFKYLLKNGIRTSVHYKPLNKFSFYKSKSKIYSSLEVSEQLYSKILSLPLFPQITMHELDLVINSIKNPKQKNAI
ncbi:MAG: UDP-4-amino-4,6-dideoxy-N-acetyl-beta-L-altrosamine transaminase [Chloroflexi bacterium]|nr:UDP-4-amino-4,6-dideoxy-N-acetyl-beta-L-altrosamine transaminase [Chloroflexota bacterium]|tara:strand:+ start:1141 stop:2325 length:1185 start_codon:yes stop_codon:yes gene_type:complete